MKGVVAASLRVEERELGEREADVGVVIFESRRVEESEDALRLRFEPGGEIEAVEYVSRVDARLPDREDARGEIPVHAPRVDPPDADGSGCARGEEENGRRYERDDTLGLSGIEVTFEDELRVCAIELGDRSERVARAVDEDGAVSTGARNHVQVVGDFLDHAAPHHQLLADDVGVPGGFAVGLEQQLGLFHTRPADDRFRERLAALDVDRMTPIAALALLAELKKEALDQ